MEATEPEATEPEQLSRDDERLEATQGSSFVTLSGIRHLAELVEACAEPARTDGGQWQAGGHK